MKFKVYSVSCWVEALFAWVTAWRPSTCGTVTSINTTLPSLRRLGQVGSLANRPQVTGHHGPETRYFPVICLFNLPVDGGVDLGPLSTFLRMQFNTSTCNQPASFEVTFGVITSDLLHTCQASSRRHNGLVCDWKAQETSAIILSQLS